MDKYTVISIVMPDPMRGYLLELIFNTVDIGW